MYWHGHGCRFFSVCVEKFSASLATTFLPPAFVCGVIPITPDSRRVGHKLQTVSMIGLVSCILALNHGSSVPSASRGTAFGRRAVALGGSLALTASASSVAAAGKEKASIAEMNERRAKIGLPPLEIIESDGTWAEHSGAFDDSFFDSSFKKRDDGLWYKFVNQPDGEKPAQGQQVSVYYTGYLEDGTKFDSAYDKKRPFEFRLGKQTVITGWEAVVSGMKVGQKVIVRIPPAFAYGSKSVGPIPPNSNLIFYMELVAVGNTL